MFILNYITIMALAISTSLTIIDFNKNSNLFGWRVVNDVVMGGQSNGEFAINSEGHAVFSGTECCWCQIRPNGAGNDNVG